jgi:uncharacterized membrane protein
MKNDGSIDEPYNKKAIFFRILDCFAWILATFGSLGGLYFGILETQTNFLKGLLQSIVTFCASFIFIIFTIHAIISLINCEDP